MIRERILQFVNHARPPTEADTRLAQHYLEPQLLNLFLAQEPRDIVHSANTARWLLDRGQDDPEFIQAALLHDVGKGPQRRLDRVAHVLLTAVGAGPVAAAPASRWEMRRALYRSRTHAATGAAALARAGASDRVVELVRLHHAAPNSDAMLQLLQQADAAT